MKRIHIIIAVLALAIPSLAYVAAPAAADGSCCKEGAACCPGPCCATNH